MMKMAFDNTDRHDLKRISSDAFAASFYEILDQICEEQISLIIDYKGQSILITPCVEENEILRA